MHYAPGTFQGMINPALSKADRRANACRLMWGFSHGLMVCSSGPQAIWCWGVLTGSITQVPACSLVMVEGGGGSHRILGSAAQVPACNRAGGEGGFHRILGSAAQVPAGSLLLGNSHRVSGSATQVPASSPVLRVLTGSSAQVPACSLVLGGWFLQILGSVAQVPACSLMLGMFSQGLGVYSLGPCWHFFLQVWTAPVI